MAATGRDVAVFVTGVSLAGLAPIVVFPGLELMPLVALFSESLGGVPLHHVVAVLFVALCAAAWVDTGRTDPQAPEVSQWE